MELFYAAQLWTRLFEVAHNGMKLLQICKLPKFDLTAGLHRNVFYFSKCFYFHPNLSEAFLICPNLTEAIGLYPNAPNVLKCF